MEKKIFLFFFLFFSNTLLFGQKYNFQNYTVDDGLPQSIVRSMLQDHFGNIWFGTIGGGVARFDGKKFVNYTTQNGLPNNVVYCIYEDSKYRIWMGTDGGGVVRFDGRTFKTFSNKERIDVAKIFCITEDLFHNIWLGTNGGGVYKLNFNSSDSLIRVANYNMELGLTNNIVRSILRDYKGNIWLGTDGGGLNHITLIDKNQLKCHPITVTDGLSSNRIFGLLEDRNHTIWVGTIGGGVCNISSKKNNSDKYSIIKLETENILPLNRITSLLEDHNGDIWMGTPGSGILKYHYSPNHLSEGKFTEYTQKEGLSNNMVFCMLQDREGQIWMGTSTGTCHFESKKFIHIDETDGLSNNRVTSVIASDSSVIWMGTNGGGLMSYNYKDKKEFKIYQQDQGLTSNVILSLFEDKNKNLWIGTQNGGVNLIPFGKTDSKLPIKSLGILQSLLHKIIYSINEDENGRIWFATHGSGLICYDPSITVKDTSNVRQYDSQNILGNNVVFCIFKDSKGNLWFGTEGGGVSWYIFNNISKTYTGFSTLNQSNGLDNTIIYCITEDYSGKLWFGTGGSGAIRFDPNGEKDKKENFTLINQLNGLSSGNIYLLVQDNQKNLWFGSEKGIDRLNLKEMNEKGNSKIKHYGKTEGFMGMECVQNSVCKDSIGRLWFGTINGITIYDPVEDHLNPIEPLIHITTVKLFSQVTDWSPYSDSVSKWYNIPYNLQLPYKQNHLTFEYIGISHKIPEKVRYQYKLEGFDINWSPVTDQNDATYSNLLPGKYTFKVNSCNEEGVWNLKPAELKFIITPPYWSTTWYHLSEIAFFLILFVLTIYFGRVKKTSRLATTLLFVTIFFTFEFVILLFEPYFENITGGASMIKLFLNFILASILIPLEKYITKLFKTKL